MNKIDLENIERLIKSGRTGEAREKIISLPSKKIPRFQAAPLADLARRVGLLNYAVRVLKPYAQADKPLDSPATNDELLCYAMTLSLLGVKSQAGRIFNKIKLHGNPEAILKYSFHLSTQWKYKKAQSLLTRYLGEKSLTKYQVMVARVNLAAAQIANREYDNAMLTIELLLTQLDPTNHQLLLGNTCELLGQIYFHMGDQARSNVYLNKADKLLGSYGGRYLIYVKKWQLLLNLQKNPSNDGVTKKITDLKNFAGLHGDWETIRDCDIHTAIINKDFKLFQKVYFGTPYQDYKKNIATYLKDFPKMPIKYIWQLQNEESNDYLNIDTAVSTNGNCLSPGESTQKLLVLLATDFYRPKFSGEVFDLLYPDEFYDPNSSPNKVYQIIHRLRAELQNSNIPISITHTTNGYSLCAEKAYGIQVSLSKKLRTRYEVLIERLRANFKHKQIRRKQIIENLNISPSSADKLIKYAIAKSNIQPHGEGAGRSYRFKKAQ